MTIIPFRLSHTDDGRTVVTEVADFSADGLAVLVLGHDPDQLHEEVSSPTYDLRVGEQYRDHRWVDPRTLEEGQEIELPPGSAVIVQTAEEVRFPLRLFGQIAPRVSLLERGVANTPSKIDPGYSGRLNITVFNHGRRTTALKRGERFCALFLNDVQPPVAAYPHASKLIGSAPGARRRLGGAVDWIEARSALIAVVALIVSATAVVASLMR